MPNSPIRAEYLRARFPKKTPNELADAAWREAVDRRDINDSVAPFDCGWCLNTYSETIASQLAQGVQNDPIWKKLLLAESQYLPGGVAAYANFILFPDALSVGTS
jgi:hypothetical protein